MEVVNVGRKWNWNWNWSTGIAAIAPACEELSHQFEEQELSNATSFENRYMYADAMAIYISLVDKGSQKALDQCHVMLKEECGLSQVHVACEAENKKASPAASYFLGFMYLEGVGVEENETEAFKYLTQADDRKYPLKSGLLYFIGTGYENGLGDVTENAKAFQYYQKASQKGSLGAAQKVLEMCLDGRAIKVDPDFVWGYLEEIASRGNRDAKAALGQMCFNTLKNANERKGLPGTF